MTGHPITRAAAVAVSAVLVASLAVAAAPPTDKPDKVARAEGRAEAKAEQQAEQQVRAATRTEAKVAKKATRIEAKVAKQTRKAERKQARQKRAKTTLCHKPGTPDEATITVGTSALAAHLAHGDREGECATEEVILAIAYTDIGSVPDEFDAGDVLIAKLVDEDGDGVPSIDDTIHMGHYPKSFTPQVFPDDFGKWQVGTHVVRRAQPPSTTFVAVYSDAGEHHWLAQPTLERYWEDPSSSYINDIGAERIRLNPMSPSRPDDSIYRSRGSTPDDPFIDVDIFYDP